MDRTPLVRRRSGERGYLMVALLVAMSVMAIMMSAAMPAWHTLAQREKESELVFRGEQYARAIGLYQRKFANAPAPSIDFLVEQRFLRKKCKDPITNGDFEVLTSGGNMPGQAQSQQAQSQASSVSSSLQQTQSGLQQLTGRTGGAAGGAQGRGGAAGGAVVAGIIGVTSKSPLKSLRLYNKRDTYNQWIFMPVAQAARAGGAGSGAGAGGGRDGGRGADGRGGVGAGDGRGRGLPQGPGGRGLPQGGVTPPSRGRF